MSEAVAAPPSLQGSPTFLFLVKTFDQPTNQPTREQKPRPPCSPEPQPSPGSRALTGVQHLNAAAVPRGMGPAEHPEARGAGGGQERGVLVARPQSAPAGGDPAERGCERGQAIGSGTGAGRGPGSSPGPARPSPSSTKCASAKAPAGSAPPSSRTRPGRRRQPSPTRPWGRSPGGLSRYLRGEGGAQSGLGPPAPLIAIHPSPPPRSQPCPPVPPPRSPLSRARPPARLQQRQRPRGHGGGPGPAGSAAGSALRFRPRRGALRRPEVAGGAASARARAKMAPLDLDKYVEIARLCKYLPENDLKVRPRRQGRDRPGRAGAERAGAGAAGRAGAGGAGGPGAGPDPAAFPSAAPL